MRMDDDKSGGNTLLFLYLVTTYQNAPIECDYNVHKSNSTFFSDLDINRAQLFSENFPRLPRWAPTPDSATEGPNADTQKTRKRDKTVSAALGGMSGVLKRENRNTQERDEKLEKREQTKEIWNAHKAILAVAVNRYLFKDGRRTAPPEEVLHCVGLYPSTPAEADQQGIYSTLRKPGSDVPGFFGSLNLLMSNFG
ncbi:hypothetical protein PITC_030620 [Penicillium italicum]|uniref:Uncharacterized protein n=1 Tax=Penicillium italicum TaxID=40296 RepID=A0A0A2LGL2_PENIT|nr:hypothetical protein PITC_030620 [Penicillium italicum]